MKTESKRQLSSNLCPRCGVATMHPEKAMNALSRRDNETYICSPCGTAEGMEDAIEQVGTHSAFLQILQECPKAQASWVEKFETGGDS